jgi:AraC-like DNA-binding protein
MDYYYHSLTDEIDVTRLITVHYFKYSRDFSAPGETHDFYELVFADSGRVELTDGTEKHALTQGQGFLHRPGVFHNIRACEVFSNIIIATFQTAAPLPPRLFGRALTVSDAGKRLLSEIVSEAAGAFAEPLDIVELYKMTPKESAPAGALQIIKGNLEKLLIYWTRETAGGVLPRESDDAPRNADKRARIVRQIERYLRDNLCEKITLAAAAAALGYSVPYLKKAFRGGIAARHLELKIEKAKEWIAEGRMNFAEISEALSFSGPQHFSAAFRKAVNMSPSEFARSVKVRKLLK